MAYDAAKAHEYYEKYRKKGLLKGRAKGATKKKSTKKKGSKKSTKKTNLVGLSTAGLNDEGKMQWAMAKEKLSSDMNAALGKAKTQEEKDKIRSEYQNKAMQELKKMKSDSSLAKEKKTSTKSSSKSSSSKGSSSKGSSSKSSKSSSNSSSSKSTAAEQATEAINQMKDMISQLTERLFGNSDLTSLDSEAIQTAVAGLSEEQKTQVRTALQSTIDAIKKKLNKE